MLNLCGLSEFKKWQALLGGMGERGEPWSWNLDRGGNTERTFGNRTPYREGIWYGRMLCNMVKGHTFSGKHRTESGLWYEGHESTGPARHVDGKRAAWRFLSRFWNSYWSSIRDRRTQADGKSATQA